MAHRFFRPRRRTASRKKTEDTPFFTPSPKPIQPKPAVGPSDDHFEKEADAVGEKAADSEVDAPKFVASTFNYNLEKVKIHTGAKSEQMNRTLKAQAFTQGNDIHFNKGKYQPATKAGKKLLAHELTHVVQQGTGATKNIQRQDDPRVASSPRPVPTRAPAPLAPGEAMSKAYFIQEMNDRYGVTDIHVGTKEEQLRRWGLPVDYALPNWAKWDPGSSSQVYNNIMDSFADFASTFGAVPQVKTLIFFRMSYSKKYSKNEPREVIMEEDKSTAGIYGNKRIKLFKSIVEESKPIAFERSSPVRTDKSIKSNSDSNAAPSYAKTDQELTVKRVLIHELGHGLVRDTKAKRGKLGGVDESLIKDWENQVGWINTTINGVTKKRLYDRNARAVQRALKAGNEPPVAFHINGQNWNDPKWIDQPVSDYSATAGSAEDFSDSLMVYVMNPQPFQSRSPLRYQFIDSRKAKWLPALRSVNSSPSSEHTTPESSTPGN